MVDVAFLKWATWNSTLLEKSSGATFTLRVPIVERYRISGSGRVSCHDDFLFFFRNQRQLLISDRSGMGPDSSGCPDDGLTDPPLFTERLRMSPRKQ